MRTLVGKLLALTVLGETGNCVAILKEDTDNFYGIKFFPGGNGNVAVPRELMEEAFDNGHVEVADEEILSEILEVFQQQYDLNNQVES